MSRWLDGQAGLLALGGLAGQRTVAHLLELHGRGLELVEEGREPLLRGIQGESEAAAARAALDEARAERDAAFAELTALAGGQTPLTSVEASLLDRVPAVSAGQAAEAPAVLALVAERDAAQRGVTGDLLELLPGRSLDELGDAGLPGWQRLTETWSLLGDREADLPVHGPRQEAEVLRRWFASVQRYGVIDQTSLLHEQVVDTCLKWALENGQDAGVWGGMSEDERRSLKRRAARARRSS